MKRLLSFSIILFLSFQVGAQELISLNLTEHGKDRYFETSKLIAPVFKLKTDSIESYQGFGVESDKPLQKFKVVLPEFKEIMDTGYTFLFSKVHETSVNGYTAVLVANYGRRIMPAIIYVDHNNNFNFTDDGEPDTFYLKLPYVDVDLTHPQNPDQKVTFRLSRFDFTKDHTFKRMADTLIRDFAGSKDYVGTNFSFREQRFNIRLNNCIVNGDSFQVALQDVNYNGKYNEAGIDRILINAYGSETVSTDYIFEINKKEGTTYFERNFKSYRIKSIDEFGRNIQFEYDANEVAKRQLLEGKRVPNLSFQDTKGKKFKLKWYKRKPVYVYFWNKSQEGFAEDTAALRIIQEKFCPMIKVIALNYGDNPKMIGTYVDVYQIQYLSGIATKANIQRFQIEEVPYGFLLKKRMKLHKKGLRPSEVLQMLENGEIQSW